MTTVVEELHVLYRDHLKKRVKDCVEVIKENLYKDVTEKGISFYRTPMTKDNEDINSELILTLTQPPYNLTVSMEAQGSNTCLLITGWSELKTVKL